MELIKDEWKGYFDEKEINNVFKFLNNNRYLPRRDEIFKCFSYFVPSDTRVVIIGQDPYYTNNKCTGLAFANPPDTPKSMSLCNIYKVLHKNFPHATITLDQTLEGWAKQGVLLLNSSLTVEQNKPNSHQWLWQKIIDNVIAKLTNEYTGIVFLMWGSHAYTKSKLINRNNNHKIIICSHPSPLSCHTTYHPFMQTLCFFDANEFLASNGKPTINWVK